MKRISPGWTLAFAALIWTLLAPHAPGWGLAVVGIVALALAVTLHLALGGAKGPAPSLFRLVQFAPWFLLQSARGGVDVARRAFTPSLPLAPAFTRYPLRLPEGPARVLFVNTISLLPGTFSARVEGDELRVHLLADDGDATHRLADLESRIGRLFPDDPASPKSPGEPA